MICLVSFTLLHKESARSIDCRFEKLTTHVPIDQKNASYYDTNFRKIFYILIILDSS